MKKCPYIMDERSPTNVKKSNVFCFKVQKCNNYEMTM